MVDALAVVVVMVIDLTAGFSCKTGSCVLKAGVCVVAGRH
jgi:hypothetical protein